MIARTNLTNIIGAAVATAMFGGGVLAIFWLLTVLWPAKSAVSASASPRSEAEKQCLMAALTEHTQASLAISTQSLPLPSIASVLAQRRLEESYCQRVVLCLQMPPATVGVVFGSCLDDEARERLKE